VEILEIPRLPAPPHTKLDMSGTRGRDVVRVTFGNTLVAPRQRERAKFIM